MTTAEGTFIDGEARWEARSRQPADLDQATRRWLEGVDRCEIQPSRQTLSELASKFQLVSAGASLGALVGAHVDN